MLILFQQAVRLVASRLQVLSCFLVPKSVNSKAFAMLLWSVPHMYSMVVNPNTYVSSYTELGDCLFQLMVSPILFGFLGPIFLLFLSRKMDFLLRVFVTLCCFVVLYDESQL